MWPRDHECYIVSDISKSHKDFVVKWHAKSLISVNWHAYRSGTLFASHPTRSRWYQGENHNEEKLQVTGEKVPNIHNMVNWQKVKSWEAAHGQQKEAGASAGGSKMQMWTAAGGCSSQVTGKGGNVWGKTLGQVEDGRSGQFFCNTVRGGGLSKIKTTEVVLQHWQWSS